MDLHSPNFQQTCSRHNVNVNKILEYKHNVGNMNVIRCKDWYVGIEKNYRKRGLIISVYLSSRPVVHLSDAPRRRLVVTRDSARIQDEITENSAWFLNVFGV